MAFGDASRGGTEARGKRTRRGLLTIEVAIAAALVIGSHLMLFSLAKLRHASETLARTLWPGEQAVGKRMKWRTDVANAPLLTVVGVAADASHRGRINSLRYPARDVYLPHAQRSDRMTVAVVRASGTPASVAGAIRAAVARLDPELPLFEIATMDEHRATEEAETRFAAVLMGTYAAVALLLAAVGIYGVLNYHVRLQSREIAVRMALGARRADVVRSVMADGMRPTLLGLALGLAGAWSMAGSLTSLLFGVEPRDPAAFVAVALILPAIAVAATLIPARSATKVDPMQALRLE